MGTLESDVAPVPEHLLKDRWGYALADDVLLRILQFCDVRTLGTASMLCTHWRDMAFANDNLWKNLFLKRFPDEDEEEQPRLRKRQKKLIECFPWRQRFANRVRVLNNFKRAKCAIIPLEHHQTAVNALHVSGDILLSASDDATVAMWDINTYSVIREFKGHDSRVLTARLDGKYVISGSDDFTVRIWDAETGKELHKLEGHTGQVECVRILDGTIYSAAWDYSIKLWDLKTGTFIATMLGHNNWVNCMEIDVHGPDGPQIVTGSHDKTIGVWNLKDMDMSHQLTGHRQFVSCLQLGRRGNDTLVYSGSADRTVKVWMLADGACLSTISLGSVVSCLRVTPDHIAVGCWDGSTRLFENDPTYDWDDGEDLLYFQAISQFKENDEEVGIRAIYLTKDMLIVGTTKFTEPYDNLIVRDFNVTPQSSSNQGGIIELDNFAFAASVPTNVRIHPVQFQRDPDIEVPPAGCSPVTSELDLAY